MISVAFFESSFFSSKPIRFRDKPGNKNLLLALSKQFYYNTIAIIVVIVVAIIVIIFIIAIIIVINILFLLKLLLYITKSIGRA